MVDIDKVGEEAATLLKTAEKNKEKLAPLLRQVWAALDAKQEVNGCKNKKAWATKFGVNLRYAYYLVRDGNRKRPEKKSVNRVHTGSLDFREGAIAFHHRD